MGYRDKARTLVKAIKALDAEAAEQVVRLYLEEARRDGRGDVQIAEVPYHVDPWAPVGDRLRHEPIWQVMPSDTTVTSGLMILSVKNSEVP